MIGWALSLILACSEPSPPPPDPSAPMTLSLKGGSDHRLGRLHVRVPEGWSAPHWAIETGDWTSEHRSGRGLAVFRLDRAPDPDEAARFALVQQRASDEVAAMSTAGFTGEHELTAERTSGIQRAFLVARGTLALPGTEQRPAYVRATAWMANPEGDLIRLSIGRTGDDPPLKAVTDALIAWMNAMSVEAR